jgi:hypothetical protein
VQVADLEGGHHVLLSALSGGLTVDVDDDTSSPSIFTG